MLTVGGHFIIYHLSTVGHVAPCNYQDVLITQTTTRIIHNLKENSSYGWSDGQVSFVQMSLSLVLFALQMK